MSALLIDTFLNQVAVPLRPGFASMIDLEQRLDALLAVGQDQWPNLSVDPLVFMRFVATRLPTGRQAEEALGAIRVGELYLTCACVLGSVQAIAAFDTYYLGEVDFALQRMRANAAQVDDVKQLVRQKLFVTEDGSAGKIADYSGRGDLRRWVRSIAVRTFLNENRKGKRLVSVSDDQLLSGMSATGDDPELAYMKERYRNEFRDAFVRALKMLSDRQQTVLRYHHVDGLSIDEIGAIYRVHRVTAYRWLEKARDALVTNIQTVLEAQLRVEKREFQSILRLIRSQLHLSLFRYLGGHDDTEPGVGSGASDTGPDDTGGQGHNR